MSTNQKHLDGKGVKRWAISDFLLHDLRHLGLGNHPQAWPVFLLLTQALAPWPRNGPFPESFRRLIVLTPLLGIKPSVFLWGYFCLDSLFPQILSIPGTLIHHVLGDNTLKSGKRDALNS